ncbi:MAG: hypothetical protein ABIN55_09695 [Aeromicrobium sp.]
MKFSIKMLIAGGIAAAALTATGGAASAAHCTDSGGPGHSDFAAHVQANNGPGGHNEGDHKGWSTCR